MILEYGKIQRDNMKCKTMIETEDIEISAGDIEHLNCNISTFLYIKFR